MLKRLLIAVTVVAASTPAWPQAAQFPSGWVQGNSGASAGQAAPASVTAILDRALGSTRGSLIERGASGWALIGPGTTGKPFISSGAGADPSYGTLGIVGGGTNCTAASGTCLDNITGFASTGFLTRTGAGTYAFQSTINGITNANLAQAAANTVKGNFTGSTANESDNAVPSCSTNNSALQYTSGSGLGCNTTMASLSVADQTITGGANVTTQSLSTGNVTIDCGSRPTQSITNGGAFTITAPSNDGYCVVLVTNNGTAGAITFSGFSVGSNTGDSLTTTNASKFMIFIYRVSGASTYSVKALQ